MDDLLKQQDDLQKEAAEVIERLGLTQYFSQFGRVEIGGSVETGLMTWRDIDAGVLVDALPERNVLIGVAERFLAIPEIVGVNISDNTQKKNPHHPLGYYVGLTYLYEGKYKWKIDLWFITPELYPDTGHTKWVKDSLTPETRQAILAIKNAIHDNPKYKKTVFSLDIYKAVFERGITDLEGFKAYLKETGREL